MPHIAGHGQTPLFYTDWGTGRPIVLLHGWALDQRMWDIQVAHLRRSGLRCITYDRRGHGRSDIPGGGYDYDTLADDLAAVLDALDLTDVLLVAHSMAAGEAVRYLAGDRGAEGRVTGLVLVGGTTPCLSASPTNPGGVPVEVLAVSNLALAQDRPQWFRDSTPAYFGEVGSADLSPRMQAALDMCLQAPLPVLQACTTTMLAADFRTDLQRILVPTLVIHGDADASAPLAVTGQPTAELLPTSRLLIYSDGPHGLYITHAGRLNDDLLHFATTHEVAPTPVPPGR